MQIAVVSDTHGHLENTREAIRVLEELDIELDIECVIHCGDVGSAGVVTLFDKWPTHFVFGNVDFEQDQLRAAIEGCGQTCHGRFGELTLAEKRIAFLHSDDRLKFLETIESGEYDLVCYGHTHSAETHQENETTVLNPGALYRATPHSFALVELPSLDVSHVRL